MKMFSLHTPMFVPTSLFLSSQKTQKRDLFQDFPANYVSHSLSLSTLSIYSLSLSVYVALSLSTYEDREIKCSASAHMKTENRANLDILDSKTLGTCARLTMCLSDLLEQLLRVFAISHLRG